MHAAAVLRLTGTERAVAEIAAIAEQVASLTAAASAFGLAPDVPTESRVATPLISLLDEESAPEAASTLREIREWSAQTLRVDRVPAVWRALAHQPRLLDTTWRKDRLILSAGTLDEPVKGCVALAVAQIRQSTYWIPYFTHILRTRSRLDDRALVEITGTVMHYMSFNVIADGMRLEPPAADITAADVGPGGRLEHIVAGLRRHHAGSE